MKSSMRETHVDVGQALSLAPLPDAVVARRSGPPRDFNCFCVFCNRADDTSMSHPRRAADRRSG
ncbi:hypothetical protein [Streptomyces sp. NPDC057939]|uniref:hypothetical protein n=1 Tax=Streptomyces sp. NPDC057939 TaxID=3346284 RepID=UPI0036F183C6